MRVPSMNQHDARYEDERDRDFGHRPSRDRYRRNRYSGFREDYSPPDDRYRSRRDSRDRDERSPHRYTDHDNDWSVRRENNHGDSRGIGADSPDYPDIPRARVWEPPTSASAAASVLEQQLHLQQQAAVAAAAAQVSQSQLLLSQAPFHLGSPFVLGPPVDPVALVNMNLAAAALQQHQQRATLTAAAGAGGGDHQQQDDAQANNTVMVRSLPQHINENDLRQEVLSCNLVPKDIRLIRKKDTGYSRGFAFIEFNTVQEAARWMQLKQGVMTLGGHRVVVQYSLLRDNGTAHSSNHHLGRGQQSQQQDNRLQDWLCTQCGGNNFKRRDTCYRCRCRRPPCSSSSSCDDDSNDEISTHPTNTLLLRGLSSTTSEEQLLSALEPRTQLPIRSVRVARDDTTGCSLHRCYLQLSSVIDAVQLYRQLTDQPLIVDSCTTNVAYCKLPEQRATTATSGSSGASASVDISRMSIQELAEYSAKMYAKTPQEYETYLKYYEDYYKTHGVAGVSSSECQSDSANAAAAVAHTALQRVLKKSPGASAASKTAESTAERNSSQSNGAAAAVFDINKTYTAPDTSTFHYDESSGYYYDASTGLYYDSSSQYFYDGHQQTYLYWNGQQSKYVLAPSSSSSSEDQQTPAAQGDDKKKFRHDDKHEKSKVAKKIAKDMERWAKTQNRRDARLHAQAAAALPTTSDGAAEATATVNNSSGGGINSLTASSSSSSSADIGFAMFGRRNQTENVGAGLRVAGGADASNTSSLVAAYGGESGDEEEPASTSSEDAASSSVHVDLEKLACLLCKRAFASRQQLNKHLTKSQLHRSNLATLSAGPGYRDRAAERREKHGSEVPPSDRHQPGPPSRHQTGPAPPVSGVGSKMMQAMGWSDGQGLGRSNQGRTELVQAGRRVASAGLGAAGSTMGTAGGSENYSDNVKRSMMARYQTS